MRELAALELANVRRELRVGRDQLRDGLVELRGLALERRQIEAQARNRLDRLAEAGVENVLPLGGDQPEAYQKPPGAFDYANEMVEYIRSEPRWRLSLAGACYPETHPSA